MINDTHECTLDCPWPCQDTARGPLTYTPDVVRPTVSTPAAEVTTLEWAVRDADGDLAVFSEASNVPGGVGARQLAQEWYDSLYGEKRTLLKREVPAWREATP